QDVTVFERTRFALVGITDEVLLPRKGTRHEAPLQTSGKTGAATSAQAGRLDLVDDLFGSHPFGENLAQGFVATARNVILQAPIVAIQVGHDLRRNMVAVQAGGQGEIEHTHHAAPAWVLSSSNKPSRRSSDI